MTELPSNSPDPGHAFLDLGERLRHRGQLDAALSVAQAGAGRFPALAAAHELIGRIRSDQGDDDGARSAWVAALECDRHSLGALKGLAFLAFREGNHPEAERRLEAAAMAAPHDTTILAALDRVRATRPLVAEEAIDFESLSAALLLFDPEGLRISGGTGEDGNADSADIAAAAGMGALREAERTASLLQMGDLRHLLIEGESHRAVVAPVDDAGGVILCRARTAPVGRVVALSAKAVRAAREWLGQQ